MGRGRRKRAEGSGGIPGIEVAPGNRVSYHLTSDPNFTVEEIEPSNGGMFYAVEGEALFISDRPDMWLANPGYHRPFVVEIEHPDEYERVMVGNRQPAPEIVIPASDFDRMKVRRVIPLEAWREEQIPRLFGGVGKPYEGPDVRDMTPEQQQALIAENDEYVVRELGVPVDSSNMSEDAKEEFRKAYPARYKSELATLREIYGPDPNTADSAYQRAYLYFLRDGGTTEEWSALPLDERLRLASGCEYWDDAKWRWTEAPADKKNTLSAR